jgi:glutamine synthetase
MAQKIEVVKKPDLDSPADVISFCRGNGLQMVDLKFTDMPGMMQHFTIPAAELSESLFSAGLGFDGSSIRGFQAIDESDMLLLPDPTTAFVDPIYSVPTLSLLCDLRDPLTRGFYWRSPRHTAEKAEAYLRSSGIGDTAYVGPEVEFFIFDSVRYDVQGYHSFYYVDSQEGIWNSGKDGGQNLGHRPRWKEGYLPTPPVDTLQDIRSEAVLKMMQAGIEVEVHHHEVATAGQGEIDMRYGHLTHMADQVMIYKYILKNVAHQHGKTVTFMPKPIFGDNGSGMHVHISLWKDGENLFWDPEGYAQMSLTGMYFIGGLLKHSPALAALVAPTVNSYRRLVPGYEAPVNLVYSQRNRSACVRIPMYALSPNAKRVEFRAPDPSCNPYLAFAAILMAGLDGIMNEIDPGDPMDVDVYELPPDEVARIQTIPGSLEKVLDALEGDCDFLLRGDVFTEDLLRTWIEYKRTQEVDPIRLRPHPYEFYMYYDI